jgi:hypothetical protein
MTGQSPGFYHVGGGSSSSAQNRLEPHSYEEEDDDVIREPNLDSTIFSDDPSAEDSDTKSVILNLGSYDSGSQRQGFPLKEKESLGPACGYLEFFQPAPERKSTPMYLYRQQEAASFVRFPPTTTRISL